MDNVINILDYSKKNGVEVTGNQRNTAIVNAAVSKNPINLIPFCEDHGIKETNARALSRLLNFSSEQLERAVAECIQFGEEVTDVSVYKKAMEIRNREKVAVNGKGLAA